MNRTWTTFSLYLQGNGIIHKASSCHVIGENFQLYPTVRGKTIYDLQHHELFLPIPFEPLSISETKKLQLVTTGDVTQLDL
jgi:hypothetical protein